MKFNVSSTLLEPMRDIYIYIGKLYDWVNGKNSSINISFCAWHAMYKKVNKIIVIHTTIKNVFDVTYTRNFNNTHTLVHKIWAVKYGFM
jgi:hypothetical protein